MKANTTHANRLHLLTDAGRALCHGKIPRRQGDDPCGRCENIRVRNEEKAKRREAREKLRAQKLADLEHGVLWLAYTGVWHLRYTLNNQIFCHSLHLRDERKAKILAPLVMANIRRTGKQINEVATCNADRG